MVFVGIFFFIAHTSLISKIKFSGDKILCKIKENKKCINSFNDKRYLFV